MRHTIAALAVVALALTACSSSPKDDHAAGESEPWCKQIKPGVVTSVNHYCAVVSDDPVDPTIVREFDGQRVGFCCNGCLPKWESWTDEQKRAAVAAAVAKGKPTA